MVSRAFLTIFLFLITIVQSSAAQAGVDTILAAHWSFDLAEGGFVFMDKSPSKNDLVAINGSANIKLSNGPYKKYGKLFNDGAELVVRNSRGKFNFKNFTVMAFVTVSNSSSSQTLFQSSSQCNGVICSYKLQITPQRTLRLCLGDSLSGWHNFESSVQ